MIELVLSLHHDQARCLHRAYEAMRILVRRSASSFPAGAEAIAMPVRQVEGDEIYARLNRWRTDRSNPWHRLVGRIGLGLDPATEAGTVPLQFQAISTTARDGHPFSPIEAEAFAVVEANRVVGGIDAGKPQLDVTRMDEEPVYVTGAGLMTEVPGVPALFQVLAVGRTAREAGMRGEAVFIGTGLAENSNIALKTARITAMDAMLIRTAMEKGLQQATGQARRVIEVGLGMVDHLADPDKWDGLDSATCAALEREPPAQMTVNHDGVPQIWDATATPDPYWGWKLQ